MRIQLNNTAIPKQNFVDGAPIQKVAPNIFGKTTKVLALRCANMLPKGSANALKKLDPLMLSQLAGPDPKYGLSFVQKDGKNFIFAEPNSLVTFSNASLAAAPTTARVPENGLLFIGGVAGDAFTGAVKDEDGKLGPALHFNSLS